MTEGKSIHPEQVLVLPVPAHLGAESRVEPIAKGFARHFGYDYQARLLRWSRDIQPQHRIFDKRERARNIAFSLEMLSSAQIKEYKSLIIVDDLTTTGSTLREAARAVQSRLLDSVNIPKIVTLTLTTVPFWVIRDKPFSYPANR